MSGHIDAENTYPTMTTKSEIVVMGMEVSEGRARYVSSRMVFRLNILFTVDDPNRLYFTILILES